MELNLTCRLSYSICQSMGYFEFQQRPMIQRGWDGQYDELTLPDHTVIVEVYLYAVLREIIQGVWSLGLLIYTNTFSLRSWSTMDWGTCWSPTSWCRVATNSRWVCPPLRTRWFQSWIMLQVHNSSSISKHCTHKWLAIRWSTWWISVSGMLPNYMNPLEWRVAPSNWEFVSL